MKERKEKKLEGYLLDKSRRLRRSFKGIMTFSKTKKKADRCQERHCHGGKW